MKHYKTYTKYNNGNGGINKFLRKNMQKLYRIIVGGITCTVMLRRWNR